MKVSCEEEYSLSTLAESFKTKVKGKQIFIERGIDLINQDIDECPFCEQKLKDNALALIDKYNKYLNDEEAKTIKLLKGYKTSLKLVIETIEEINISNVKRIHTFNNYKEKYIPSSKDVDLLDLELENLKSGIQTIIEKVDLKLTDISKSILLDEEIIASVKKYKTILNGDIEANNKKIKEINDKKNSIGKENLEIRKQICKRTFDDLINVHKTNIKSLNKLRIDYKKLNADILKKKEKEKVSKKKEVASTIKTVLNYFFADKYTLDEESFRLTFKTTILERKQAKDVLSAGEKNIVAFAYYIGDSHLKVGTEDDYNKLFFIIDDPISSMDFSHVYTVCGVIRDIKNILNKINRERMMIFTHNNDFMRILSSNNIIDKKLLLSKGELTDFNNNLTVPYITHLFDIYKVARKGEIPSHTTANSIRHIIETLTKFDKIETHRDSIASYIEEKFPQDTKSYTLINDLSHGGWRTEQAPITNEDYKDVCELVVNHIEKEFKGQIDYCENMC